MKVATDTTAPRNQSLPDASHFGTAYETNYNQVMANHCRDEYLRSYTLLQQLHAHKVAGIQGITLYTPAGTVTIPLIGPTAHKRAMALWAELSEVLGDRLTDLEKDILNYEKDSLDNEPQEREGTGERAEAFNFCLPMRPMSDAEFNAMPIEARRAYDERRAEQQPTAA